MCYNINMKVARQRGARRALIAAAFVIYALFLASLFAISVNYPALYDTPVPKAGRVDLSGVPLDRRKVSCSLAGEWEFFYGRWIVTDGEASEPDGFLTVPEIWTGHDFGKGALPREGYASYRLTLENVPQGMQVYAFRVNFSGAYRVFFNGKLTAESGTMSKAPLKTRPSGVLDHYEPYESDGTPITVVVELSATYGGGLTGAPWLTAYQGRSGRYGTELRVLSSVSLGISVAALAASLLLFFFFRFKRDGSIPLLLAALFVHFLASGDFTTIGLIPFGICALLSPISAVLALCFFLVHLKRQGVVFPKKFLILGVLLFFAAWGAFLLSYGTHAAPYFALAAFLIALLPVIPVVLSKKLRFSLAAVYAGLLFFMVGIFSFELIGRLGLVVYGTEYLFSVAIMAVIAFFAALGFWRIAANVREAMRAHELEQALTEARRQALMAQIKPHFVFNSLAAIQAMYRVGIEEGDEAMERFARHLRLGIDSDGSATVPFEQELKNVMNYFELENMRTGGALTLLLDINETEFSVPVLSIQPLIENAIRHGETQSRENGYILLYSGSEGDRVIVKVTDNGKGFDPQKTPLGVGLENVRERFFGLLDADMVITSEIGKGTEIVISIPKERG